MRRFIALSLLFFACSVLSNPAFAARYVPIKVYLDDQVILEGHASDDGRPDADAVWYAVKTAKLGETEAFKVLLGEHADDEFLINKKGSDGERSLRVKIDVRYGGMAEVFKLRVRRVPADSAGRGWTIHPEEVGRLFNRRFIRRSDVARLGDPNRSK